MASVQEPESEENSQLNSGSGPEILEQIRCIFGWLEFGGEELVLVSSFQPEQNVVYIQPYRMRAIISYNFTGTFLLWIKLELNKDERSVHGKKGNDTQWGSDMRQYGKT